ncbi:MULTISPECIES: hypothetical protein [Lactobacillus]|uniref:Uncharacterized protein n=1 Tax=Lactobacillus helsingborgensis TaxID=1218494 RepID=A0AA47B5N3_9LACO|nr:MULTISPECIES: hypothetical protein [Lactobacillus]UZX30601.1 hypothetical protein LDX53_08935 [Lactobacillus helsingborgensis]
MTNNIIILLTSTAFGILISMFIGLYQWHVKTKLESYEKERERLYGDIKFYHQKYQEDEDEIDLLKNEIRELKMSHGNEEEGRWKND